MRWPFVLVCLAACYSPQVPFGVPCDDGTGCPAGQVCVSRGGRQTCQPAGSTGDIDGGTGSDSASVDWWDTAWAYRRPIDIAATTAAPENYAFAVNFDHAAVVAAGKALASGDDVRIVRDDGVELDRVLDTGADWNRSATLLWFGNQGQIPVGGSLHLWLYYGNPSAGAGPESSNMFVLADGFEGFLTKWSPEPGVGRDTARAHHGTHAVVVPPQDNTSDGAGLPSKTIDETDLAFDAWWNIEDTSAIDMSQSVRSNNSSVYFTDLQESPPVFDISKVDNGNYFQLIPPPSGAASPPENSWFRVTVYAYQQTMAIDFEGTRYVPTSGFSSIGTATSGGVYLGSYRGTGRVWFDDVTVRKLVVPEPTVMLGAEQALP